MPLAPKAHRPPHSQAAKRDERRPSAAKRGYDRKWREATEAWIAEQFAAGNCRCARCGKMLTGDRKDIHVDHKIPHNGKDDPVYWDRNNWQALHPWCHSAKTVKDGRKSDRTTGGA